MRDLLLYAHLILGIYIIIGSLMIYLNIKNRPSWLKPVAITTAAAAWLLLIPAGDLYLVFYPATKLLVKAGAWPWAHSIFMETKEHWGILLPIIATVGTGLILDKKLVASKKWWLLVAVLSLLIGIMGRIVVMGGTI